MDLARLHIMFNQRHVVLLRVHEVGDVGEGFVLEVAVRDGLLHVSPQRQASPSHHHQAHAAPPSHVSLSDSNMSFAQGRPGQLPKLPGRGLGPQHPAAV